RHIEKVPDDARAMSARGGDDRGALGHRWIRVVDDHGGASRQCLFERAALARLAARRVRPRVFADVPVGGPEVLLIERRFAGARQADENDAFGDQYRQPCAISQHRARGDASDLHWIALASGLRYGQMTRIPATRRGPEEGMAVSETSKPTDDLAPIAASPEQPVEVLPTSMRIHELLIERPAIVAYLQTIPVDKQTVALVHALEVGVTELVARRERFKKTA